MRRTSGSERVVRVAITHDPGHETAGEVDHLRGSRASTDNTPGRRLSFPAPGFVSATWPTTFFVAWDRSGASVAHRRRLVAVWAGFAESEGVSGRCGAPPVLVAAAGPPDLGEWRSHVPSEPLLLFACIHDRTEGRVACRAASLSPGRELLLAGEWRGEGWVAGGVLGPVWCRRPLPAVRDTLFRWASERPAPGGAPA